MSVAENKAIMRRIVNELFGQGTASALEDLIAPDFVDHNSVKPVDGPEAILQAFAMLRTALPDLDAAFPDLHTTVDDIIAEGDKVVVRGSERGTHRGEFRGVAATEALVVVPAYNVFRIVDGKIMERWGSVDGLSFVRQLGLLPDPPQASG